jgi:hypothetical protein
MRGPVGVFEVGLPLLLEENLLLERRVRLHVHLQNGDISSIIIGFISWGPMTPVIGIIGFVPITYQRFVTKIYQVV